MFDKLLNFLWEKHLIWKVPYKVQTSCSRKVNKENFRRIDFAVDTNENFTTRLFDVVEYSADLYEEKIVIWHRF